MRPPRSSICPSLRNFTATLYSGIIRGIFTVSAALIYISGNAFIEVLYYLDDICSNEHDQFFGYFSNYFIKFF